MSRGPVRSVTGAELRFDVDPHCRLCARVYAAATILVAGLVHKIVQYARTPAPLKIPTTPAPVTRAGVAARIGREVVLFESLFKASKWTWLFGWIFHAALLVVLIGHLRYFTEPVWAPVAFVRGSLRTRGSR